MQGLDAIDVSRQGTSSSWGTEDRLARESAVTLDFIADVCAPGDQILVDGSGATKYDTAPVGLIATLDRPTNCTEDDDASWLSKALANSLELGVAQALVSAPGGGTDAGVWFKHSSVTNTEGGGTGTVDASTIGLGRSDWFAHTVWDRKVKPLLHLPPALAPELAAAGLLHVTGTGETITVWGDDVVMSPAYDWAGGKWAAWTGPIKVDVSATETTGTIVNRQNRASTGDTVLFRIDTPPCSIVLVGDFPVT